MPGERTRDGEHLFADRAAVEQRRGGPEEQTVDAEGGSVQYQGRPECLAWQIADGQEAQDGAGNQDDERGPEQPLPPAQPKDDPGPEEIKLLLDAKRPEAETGE